MTSARYEWLVNTLASCVIVGVWLLLSWLASLVISGCTWERALLLVLAFTLAERLPSKRKHLND